jgi:hypothetical protein
MWKVVQLEKYFDFSLYSHHFSMLSLTSLLLAPEREVTSPSDFKVVGALYLQCAISNNIWSTMICDQRHNTIIYNILWLSTIIWLSTIYYQWQYMIIYNIWSEPINDYLQYMISDNIQLSTIYDQRQYTISDNIRFSSTYDYLQYKISDIMQLSIIYEQKQYMIIYNILSATICDYL